MRTLIALTVIAAGLASPSWALFVENRTQWNALGVQRQADYAMGLMDGMMVGDTHSPYSLANSMGLYNCLRGLQLNSGDLVTLVNEGYAADASRWGEPPMELLRDQAWKVCRTYINAERTTAGLTLLPQAD